MHTLWGLLVLTAPIQARAGCLAPYPVDLLLEDMLAVERVLRQGEEGEPVSELALRLERGLGCMDTLMPRPITARVYRAVGSGLVAGGETEHGLRWLRTAAELDPTFAYDARELASASGVDAAYAEALATERPAPVPAPGSRLVSGAFVLDGRRIGAPAARPDRDHQLQRDDGEAVTSWVVSGNRFPPEVLEPGLPPAQLERVHPEPGITRCAYPIPRAKRPLMITGVALTLGSGVGYALSQRPRAAFLAANNEDELLRYQTATNRTMAASTASLALGLGLFGWGALLDSGPGLP